jgi:hypothetical protein
MKDRCSKPWTATRGMRHLKRPLGPTGLGQETSQSCDRVIDGPVVMYSLLGCGTMRTGTEVSLIICYQTVTNFTVLAT